jgi:hypothetical protein
MNDVKALVASFKADPNRAFTDAEAETLAAAAPTDLWAAKAAAIHFFRNKDLDRSLGLMTLVAEREPSSENIRNVAVAMRSLRQFKEAVQWLEDRRDAIDPIELNDMLCSLATRLQDREKAVLHGDEALRLKDAAVPRIEITEPVIRTFDPENRAANVIAFSLWGSDPRYLRGALTNASVARYLYPGWTPRFYIDNSVPEAIRGALERNGAQLVNVEHLPAAKYGLFWRFLVEDDPSVDLYLIRDADSVVNIKERWAVADWLGSGKAFHVMRDSSQHSELILAGMWGAHRGNIGGMEDRVRAFVDSRPRTANYVVADQHFLRQAVWPIVRENVCTHDSYFNFMSPRRFSNEFALPRSMHIGQNDQVHFKSGK